MERPAKERLIGAVVIVTVAWLLIPVFLDEGGGEGDAVVARELALPDPDRANGAAMRRETVSLEEPQAGTAAETSSEPAPITALPVPEAATDSRETPPPPETAPEPVAEADSGEGDAADTVAETPREPEPGPETEAPAAAEQAPARSTTPAAGQGATAADGLWAVQLGSFSDRNNAQRLAGQLREQGYPAFLSQVESGGNTMHRVRVGPQASREAAAEVAARLKAAGQSVGVVRHP